MKVNTQQQQRVSEQLAKQAGEAESLPTTDRASTQRTELLDQKQQETPTPLHRGMHGPEVFVLQEKLNNFGLTDTRLKLDGSFGFQTLRAVMRVQEFLNEACDCKLEVDGAYGKQTNTALEQFLKDKKPGEIRSAFHEWASTRLQKQLGPIFLQAGFLHNGAPYRFEATTVDGFIMRLDTARAFVLMRQEARYDSIKLEIESAFRDMAKQEKLYLAYLKNKELKEQGKIDGPVYPAAKPGHSDHQGGTALDIKACWNGSPVHSWLRQHAAEYGFKSIRHDPVHWKYLPQISR